MFVETVEDGDDIVVLFKEFISFDLLVMILCAKISEESEFMSCCDTII